MALALNDSIQTDGVGCNLLFEQGTPDEMIHKTGKGGQQLARVINISLMLTMSLNILKI